MTFEKAMGWHGENIASHATMTNLVAIPSILIYVLALRDKKMDFHPGVMSFKQGFISGVIISVIVALLSPLSQYVILEFITPNYFSTVIEYVVSTGEMIKEATEASFNLKSYIIQSIVGVLIIGVLTSAIVELLVKTKNSTTTAS